MQTFYKLKSQQQEKYYIYDHLNLGVLLYPAHSTDFSTPLIFKCSGIPSTKSFGAISCSILIDEEELLLPSWYTNTPTLGHILSAILFYFKKHNLWYSFISEDSSFNHIFVALARQNVIPAIESVARNLFWLTETLDESLGSLIDDFIVRGENSYADE